MHTPPLNFNGAPDFRAIDPALIAPAIDQLLAEADAARQHAAGPDVAANYTALAAALDLPVERLTMAWHLVSHLHGVADTPALRASYLACLPGVSAFFTALDGDVALYRKYRKAAGDASLSSQQARATALTVEAARLSGAELDAADKARFAVLAQRRAMLTQRFSSNVLDATDRFAMYVALPEMEGVPTDVLEATRKAAAADGYEGCKLNVQQATYSAIMRQASNRALREKLYHAHVTRASEFGPAELDNTALMDELLALRHETAALLGLANYAELSLAPKMAQSPAQVTAFLDELAASARASAVSEIEEVRTFAREELGLDELQAWDLPFASERLRQARFAFSQSEVKRYFQVDRVLNSLLQLVQRIADVEITAADVPVWHDSVSAWRVTRRGEVLGLFYLDLYARAGKRGGAWVDGLQPRWRHGEHLRTALSCLVCNFTAPGDDGVATIGHDELITLFHEFGHNLHVLLSTVEVRGVSGFSGVEWDAVELPSQLMENFAWQWDVVEPLSAHVDDGRPLPRKLFDKMLAARNFQSGLGLLRQIEFALFDMKLHLREQPDTLAQRLLDQVRQQVAVLQVPAYNRFAHGFSHIFAGGYAAGYYSYLWAEVLSADAWDAFEEAGVLDQGTWDRFRSEILEVGGSRPAASNFQAFRGRAPNSAAMLRQRAIEAPVTPAAA
ncbi:M3 family metallopeptidase [Janthinobacterium aquaticum]|uniref:M3 family metallopeptidase n=1 Tax=Janthinobacterium sp. FT58W TaxID=2654254 RepID=UPI00126473BE|nr:M3 family metallopeptidase [Janthinobacterium sp. FT58W]KAB8045048.1 oligopeptidase A [Janthinobacterium sp. FT58W]